MYLIPISTAELYYDPHFLDPEEAAELFHALLTKCAWTQHKVSFGHPVPRDEAYYGDEGTHYTYSRREYNFRVIRFIHVRLLRRNPFGATGG